MKLLLALRKNWKSAVYVWLLIGFAASQATYGLLVEKPPTEKRVLSWVTTTAAHTALGLVSAGAVAWQVADRR